MSSSSQPPVSARALSLFEASLDQPTDDRRAWLNTQIGGDLELAAAVERLLEADGGDHELLDEGLGFQPGSGMIGRRLGAWRITAVLAEGGMGSVYQAEREDGGYRQHAAVKIIRGRLFQAPQLVRDQLLARFRVERQVLANITHDNVARILDGGNTSDGLPYLVMEYIDGQSLTDYVRQRQLSLNDRLHLFMQLLDAMGAVHASMIVHRDLKPSNVMVTDAGQIKLLDFGIAKVLDTGSPEAAVYTMTGSSAMTPDYASPEQLRGDPVTLASDIYALGLLLYQLLGGRPAYQVSNTTPTEAERIVCQDDPVPPSSALRQAAPTHVRHGTADLRGDLDAIVMKALRKEPGLRYASSAEMRADIERYLAGLPVRARRNSRSYRFGKYLRRNRGLLAAVGAVFSALAVGLVVAFGQAQRANEEAEKARSEAAKAVAVSEYLQDLLTQGDPFEAPEAPTVRDVLEQSEGQIGDRFADHPEVEAAVRRTLGWALLNLGKPDLADNNLVRAYELNLEVYGSSHETTIQSRSDLGWLAHERDLLDEAKRWYEAAIDSFSDDTPELLKANVYNDYGVVLNWYDENEPSLAMLQMAQALVEQVDPGTEDHDPAMTVGNLAATLHSLGRLEEAETYYLRDIQLKESAPGGEDPNLMYSYNNLATLYADQKRFDEVMPLMEQSIELRRRVLGPEHPSLGRALSNLTVVNVRAGNLDAAQRALDEAAAISADLPETHDTRFRLRINQGRILHARGEYPAALRYVASALADAEAVTNRNIDEIAAQLGLLLAQCHAGLGDAEQAIAAASTALDRRRNVYGEDHFLTEQARAALEQYRSM